MVKQEYDALGRVFKTTQYASAVGPLANFDRATIEAAVNAVAGANDRKVHYVYDAAGRQRFVLQTDSERDTGPSARAATTPFGNLVESRRYDRYVTDAWIATADATQSARGSANRTCVDELSALGYSDARRARWQTFSAHTSPTTRRTSCASPSMRSAASPRTSTTPWATRDSTVRFAARPALTPDTRERAIDAAVDRNDAQQSGASLRLRCDRTARASPCRCRTERRIGRQAPDHRAALRRLRPAGRNAAPTPRRWATSTRGTTRRYDEAASPPRSWPTPVNDRVSAVAYDAGGRQAFLGREFFEAEAVDQYVVTQAGPRRAGPTGAAHRLRLTPGPGAVRRGQRGRARWSPTPGTIAPRPTSMTPPGACASRSSPTCRSAKAITTRSTR